MDEKSILALAKRFKSASVRLVLHSPETFLRLFANKGSLPTPNELMNVIDLGYPAEIAPIVRFVIGILFALNAIGRQEGSFLYRTLFLESKEETFQDAYSRSPFYRIKKKAIGDLCLLLAK